MSALLRAAFLACIVAVASNPLSEDERKTMFAELIGSCQAKEGTPDNEVQAAIANAPPASRSAQCFHACMMENLGLMIDGKISLEGGIKLAEMSGHPAKVINSEDVGKECQSADAADRCDAAVAIMTCIGQAATKRGLDPMKDLH